MTGLFFGIVVAVVLAWAVFLAALAVWRPKGIDLREAARLVPDIVRLVRALAADRTLPPGVRRRVVFLLAYLAMPFDPVPDFIPVLGYADDVVVAAVVLRGVVRVAGAAAIEARWQGTDAGLAVVRRLAGLAPGRDGRD